MGELITVPELPPQQVSAPAETDAAGEIAAPEPPRRRGRFMHPLQWAETRHRTLAKINAGFISCYPRQGRDDGDVTWEPVEDDGVRMSAWLVGWLMDPVIRPLWAPDDRNGSRTTLRRVQLTPHGHQFLNKWDASRGRVAAEPAARAARPPATHRAAAASAGEVS
ncbi:hypothetical protein [Actinophytocola sp.]|uniref:hypothetical protein n=1 Tax=Actinophytocola sp. TaxID=1872138 RepID=UPI0025B8ACA7|nr:hypothetical protein [Actinophytocola sp.]